jgi:hypothetical protein
VADLNSDRKWQLLQSWYAESLAAGVPFCEHLLSKSNAAAASGGMGESRLIGSTSNAGQSVTYAPIADQPYEPGSENDFLAACARACPVCTVPDPATEADYLNCLVDDFCQPDALSYQKSYGLLRR